MNRVYIEAVFFAAIMGTIDYIFPQHILSNIYAEVAVTCIISWTMCVAIILHLLGIKEEQTTITQESSTK